MCTQSIYIYIHWLDGLRLDDVYYKLHFSEQAMKTPRGWESMLAGKLHLYQLILRTVIVVYTIMIMNIITIITDCSG